MSYKNKAFYQGKIEIFVDFSAEEISSEEAIVSLKKARKGILVANQKSKFSQQKK